VGRDTTRTLPRDEHHVVDHRARAAWTAMDVRRTK
jgi:hypothetical protein